MDRNCDKCIHHTSGECSRWSCEFETLEDHDERIRKEERQKFDNERVTLIRQIKDLVYKQGYQDGGSDMEQAKQIIIDSLLKQIEQIRAEVIEECADKFADVLSNMNEICGRNCPIKCNWGTEIGCKDMCKQWFLEQLKEQK